MTSVEAIAIAERSIATLRDLRECGGECKACAHDDEAIRVLRIVAEYMSAVEALQASMNASKMIPVLSPPGSGPIPETVPMILFKEEP